MDGIQSYKFQSIWLKSISTLLFYFLAQNSFADELQRDYRSANYLGRGDAGIADATGSDAVFYNPSGIAREKNIFKEFVLISPHFEASENIKSLYKSMSNSNKNALDILSENQNKVFTAAAQNYTGIIFKSVALGFYDRANASAYIGTDTASGIPVAKLYGANRFGIHLTLAREFLNEYFLIGINGKYIQKKEANLSISALDAETKFSNNTLTKMIEDSVNTGNGVGLDIGMTIFLNKSNNTAIGLNYRNIGMSYRWSVPEGSQRPSTEPNVLDLGFTTSFGTKKSRITFNADLRDVINAQKVQVQKRTHLGLEYFLNNTIGVMTGLNQGYGTYSITLNLKLIKADVGMYTEELGDKVGTLPSQRYFGRLSLGWLL